MAGTAFYFLLADKVYIPDLLMKAEINYLFSKGVSE